ncbi:MAG: thiol:disulfide interchange protein DsbA/DsbL [Pseudomonadales bacterium]|nr:thiol:disulfide interchange protein DsbA/DsbL [Pseudomonadales bacterium]
MQLKLNNHVFALFTILTLLLSPMLSAETYQAGVHYVEVPVQKNVARSDKIQVTEFFWYGCPHCFDFDPIVREWQATLADDIVFTHSPSMWNKPMRLHARAYYTATALGVLDKVHTPLFDAMDSQDPGLQSKAEIAKIFEEQGVDTEEFNKTFDAFGTITKVKQADRRARSLRISGVPSMVVNDKYRVTAGMVKTYDEMIKVVDYLIEKERSLLKK